MPMVTIDSPAGTLTSSQKATLAEDLTCVLLEIEGGGDTPFGRAGTSVRFREIAAGDWYIGGRNDGTYVSPSGLFLVQIYVPEGLLDQASRSHAHKAVTEAVARVAGFTLEDARHVWVEVFEWPEGVLASGGNTIGLFRIAARAGHRADHPVLAFPRAYFDAKDRLLDAHGFPEGTTGRGLDRY